MEKANVWYHQNMFNTTACIMYLSQVRVKVFFRRVFCVYMYKLKQDLHKCIYTGFDFMVRYIARHKRLNYNLIEGLVTLPNLTNT